MAKRRRQQDSDADCEHAAAVLCDMLEAVPCVRLGGQEMTGRFAAQRARRRPVEKRRLAGRRLLRQYRRDTGCQGVIDWQRLHEWLREHSSELTLVSIFLTIIKILIIL